MADRTGVEPAALPPLYDSVDPSFLASILEADDDETAVTFRYCGYDVTVRADGVIFLDE